MDHQKIAQELAAKHPRFSVGTILQILQALGPVVVNDLPALEDLFGAIVGAFGGKPATRMKDEG